MPAGWDGIAVLGRGIVAIEGDDQAVHGAARRHVMVDDLAADR